MHEFNALGPNSVAATPIQLVLLEPYSVYIYL